MVPDQFLLRCSEDLIRVTVPQVPLEHEREFFYVGQFLYIVRVDLLLLHPVVVKR